MCPHLTEMILSNSARCFVVVFDISALVMCLDSAIGALFAFCTAIVINNYLFEMKNPWACCLSDLVSKGLRHGD